MRVRFYKFGILLLALLLAASPLVPAPGRAEAQMRCPGASPQSAPCARIELPASGLTEKQVYSKLMACCRSMQSDSKQSDSKQSDSKMMQSCPMQHFAWVTALHHSIQEATFHRGTLSARRCLVSIRVSTVPTTLAAPRARWLLTAAPALAPPEAAQALVLLVRPACPAFWTYSPVLSLHAAPCLHGLRAPPVA